MSKAWYMAKWTGIFLAFFLITGLWFQNYDLKLTIIAYQQELDQVLREKQRTLQKMQAIIADCEKKNK